MKNPVTSRVKEGEAGVTVLVLAQTADSLAVFCNLQLKVFIVQDVHVFCLCGRIFSLNDSKM